MTDDPKPPITAEEVERRRGHVRAAIADSRIEGMAPPGQRERTIFEAYIRGEIEAGDLVRAYKEASSKDGPDWSLCPDVESVPGRCSGAWVVKNSRVIVESCILGNAEDGATPEEIADWFEVPGGVDVVKRILRFAATGLGS
jgi:uncharacterized protein (DUF433 family)